MNPETEKSLFRALRYQDQPSLLSRPEFEGFATTDEILAAHADGRLTSAQQEWLTVALANSNILRQQWVALLESRETVAARQGVWRRFAMAGAAASVLLAGVLVFVNDPPQEFSPPASPMAESHPAPQAGAQVDAPMRKQSSADQSFAFEDRAEPPQRPAAALAMPVPDWNGFMAVYAGDQAHLSDSPEGRFQALALSLRHLQQEDCSVAAAETFLQRLTLSRQDYPAPLSPLEPGLTADACALGEQLIQMARQAVGQ